MMEAHDNENHEGLQAIDLEDDVREARLQMAHKMAGVLPCDPVDGNAILDMARTIYRVMSDLRRSQERDLAG